MWVTRQDSVNFQQEYLIENKILDARSEKNTLEIFKSPAFEEIALLNQKQLLLKTLLSQESELLAHIPLCVHPTPKRVLIAGSFNLEVAFEALRHEETQVDFLQRDEKILHSLISFFPHFQETLHHPRFRVIEEIDSLKRYEVIIHTSLLSLEEIAPLFDSLSLDGIFITRLENLLLHTESMRRYLLGIARHFSIAMPFVSPFSLNADSHFLFASRRFHPQADLLLQRADMLEGLHCYHAELHESAFVLPKFLADSLQGSIKN